MPTYDPLRPGYVVADTPPTEEQQRIAEYVGTPLNPDTNLPMPSPTDLQRQLVNELIDRDDADAFTRDEVAALLTEAVIRQHGRDVRAAIRSLHERADAHWGLANQHAAAARKAAEAADRRTAAADLSLAYDHARDARLLTGLHLDMRA